MTHCAVVEYMIDSIKNKSIITDIIKNKIYDKDIYDKDIYKTPTTNLNKLRHVNSSKCCICLESISNIAFIPCGHVSTCYSCCKKITICPICRIKITIKQQLFFS